MKKAILDVAEFHKKHNFPMCISLAKCNNNSATEELLRAYSVIKARADILETAANTHKDDIRLVRAHLMVEELAEIVLALAQTDEELLLDGLADEEYVTKGTALTFGLPLAEAFNEVHSSNMTKAVRDPDDIRLRNKGASFQKPDIKYILDTFRYKKDV